MTKSDVRRRAAYQRIIDGRVRTGRSFCRYGPRPRNEYSSMGKRLHVSVVDDDESVRESLPDLLRVLGFAAEAFSSAEGFLGSDAFTQTSCLILDVAMPGMSGPELQQELIRRRQDIPIVFITAGGDESVRPYLIAQGAVECLFKPLSKAALVAALDTALRVT